MHVLHIVVCPFVLFLCRDNDRKIFEVMTSTLPEGTLGSVASLLSATLYQGNPDGNYKLWNIVSSERDILNMQVLLECCYILISSKYSSFD
jgi:hypothetical protein